MKSSIMIIIAAMTLVLGCSRGSISPIVPSDSGLSAVDLKLPDAAELKKAFGKVNDEVFKNLGYGLKVASKEADCQDKNFALARSWMKVDELKSKKVSKNCAYDITLSIGHFQANALSPVYLDTKDGKYTTAKVTTATVTARIQLCITGEGEKAGFGKEGTCAAVVNPDDQLADVVISFELPTQDSANPDDSADDDAAKLLSTANIKVPDHVSCQMTSLRESFSSGYTNKYTRTMDLWKGIGHCDQYEGFSNYVTELPSMPVNDNQRCQDLGMEQARKDVLGKIRTHCGL